jgi:lysozyme family protein
MTERFKKIVIPFIWKWEGTKFEDDPDDHGNDGTKYRGTKYGIDARSHPNTDIKNLTAEKAMEIYWNEYWIKCACDDFDWPMSFIFFNCCVNCGIGRANKILKLTGKNPKKFLEEQEDFYKRLAEARPTSKKYLKGWLARTEDLRKITIGA